MTQNLNSHQDGAVRGEYPLLEEFEDLWQEAIEMCEKHRHTRAFGGMSVVTTLPYITS